MKKVFLFSLLSIIFSLLISCGNYNAPSIETKEAVDYFKLAEEYELGYEYDIAIECLEKIDEEDQNYEDAREKIAKLSNDAKINKFVAKSMVALKDQKIISSPLDATQIGYGRISDYGLSVTCRINGYGYSVSEKEIPSPLNDTGLGTYVSIYKNKLTGLFISEFISVYKDNGFLSSTTNQIMQEGSDAEYQMVELFTDKSCVNTNLVSRYFELYYFDQDMTIFD